MIELIYRCYEFFIFEYADIIKLFRKTFLDLQIKYFWFLEKKCGSSMHIVKSALKHVYKI